jgi:phage-related protein
MASTESLGLMLFTIEIMKPRLTSSGLSSFTLAFTNCRRMPCIALDWLRSLVDADRQAVGLDLMRVQYRWPVGMPLCRALGDGLWEVRTSLPSNRIARVLFSVQQGRILVLHGFIKKTQKTPADDLALRAAETVNLKNDGDQYGHEEESNPAHRQTHHAR